MSRDAYVLELGRVPYEEAWALQRSLAGAVAQEAIPDTVVLLEHPPVITLGRRSDPGELHIPSGAEVDVVETNRGGKSTYHGPGQLVCYPILDLTRHGSDVKWYVRMLEKALFRTIAVFGLQGTRFEGDNMAGVWLHPPPRKIASIGVHISKWITTHGYALNVDLDPAPFTEWITACGLEGAAFTTMAREAGRPITVDEVRPHALAALAEVFDLEFEELPAAERGRLWPVTVQPNRPPPASPSGTSGNDLSGRYAGLRTPALGLGQPAPNRHRCRGPASHAQGSDPSGLTSVRSPDRPGWPVR